MEHLDMQTPDGNKINLDALYKICPSAFTEGKGEDGTTITRKIDFDKLKSLLGDSIISGAPEIYDFTWVGKRAAQRDAATRITKTLRPCPEESVDWDTTKNLYIEGDNLEVLKLLQNSYMGKVKMIYIDPPYNTGNDFVYHDNFATSSEEYGDLYKDEDGNKYLKNTDSNGRFHSDWCSMIFSRLLVARTLLRPDGIIFISIDENEVQNMRKICDEVFGEQNFISQLGWQKVYSPKNQARYFSNDYEFILCYSKNIDDLKIGELPRTDEMNSRYKNPDNDPKGPWKPGDCVGNGERKNGHYVVKGPTGKEFDVPQGKHWVYAPETMKILLENNGIYFGKDGNAFPAVKQYLSEVSGRKASSLLLYEDYGHTDMAKKDVIKLFQDCEKVPFDTPKPVKLIKMLSIIGSGENDIILDFFSGSGTTAQSVFELNKESETSNRKFILVQIDEKITDNDDCLRLGLDTLSKVGMERIRRAGRIIKESVGMFKDSLDTGFRVFKCDESNMKDVYFSPSEYDQGMIAGLEDNIKDDRTDLDLLFDCMLRWGIELSLPVSSTQTGDCTIHNVNDGDLIACFNGNITEETIDTIASMSPLRVVFRDKSFEEASTKMNLFELFKQKCNWTDEEVKNNVKVI